MSAGVDTSLDTGALDRHLRAEDRRPAGALTATLIAGGRSNLTYRLDIGDTAWVLRRPPLGHVLPSAHDMRREWTVLAALAPTQIPVPEPILLCEQLDVIGAPFLLMEFVDGRVVQGAAEAAALDAGDARRSSEALIDNLVALHALDPAAVGLASLGRPDGYLPRQITRWRRQWQSSSPDAPAALDDLAATLERNLPASPGAAIVHGDYRLGNMILAAEDPGRVAAVIDWEMATLGDPLSDLGLLLAYCDPASDGLTAGGFALDANPGFLRPDALAERYARATGASLDQLDFYRVFGLYKLAAIGQTIVARHQQGSAIGEELDRVESAVATLLAAAHERAAATLG